MSSKGKQIASKGKRKCDSDGEKSKPRKNRKNPGVLQFFEDAAEVDHDEPSDDSDFDNDFMEEGFDIDPKLNNKPGKAFSLPVFPKEEELDEEFDKVMEERYKPGSGFVTYAGDDYEAKKSIERNSLMPSAKDPTIWKVKCMVGRERHSAFCLMQKFVDLQSLDTKLKIISAFTVDNIKGFIFIEADKQCDINESCKGLCSIYSTRVAPVPKNEVSHLLSVRNKYNEVSEGMWARVKNGNYKGDLAQVMAVNETRKKATIKLIPRIDLRSMAQKFGGGVSAKKSVIPAPRLISSSELEEFRPLIQYRRDRDTGKVFEVLDGLMLKDGYLYKKVSIDSLSCTGVMPLDEELLKFKASEINESDDAGWLSQLYGEQKKKQSIKIDKGGEKGDGSSSSSMVNSYELFDLVCFGRRDFGLIIGMEKDDHYKILKDGPEGSVVVTLEQNEFKNGSIDKKFTALDQRMKTISFNDTVRVLEGPSKDRQGIVRHIYRGTIFLYDENETENCGYFCCKSQMCEKIKLSVDASNEKGGSGASVFEDFMSSPKSPQSPKKPWQARENNSDFNKGDKDGMFSIGQTLRIRVGPLKGYICRVLAIRYQDVTVKLDSQQKVLTVKCEHLSEVRGKSSSMSTSEDPGSSSFKPFDLLGTDGSSRDWTDGAGTSAEGDGWNAGGLSAGGSSWPSFSTSGNTLQPESNPPNLFGSVDNDIKKGVENTAWESKATPNQNSSWGTSSADEKAVANSGWGKSEDGWGKAAAKIGSGSGASDSWGKAIASSGDQAGSSKDAGDSWGQAKPKVGSPVDSSNDVAASWGKNKNVNDDQDSWKKSENWDKGKNVSGNSSSSWGGVISGKDQLDSWGKGKDVVVGDGSTWGKAVESELKGTGWSNLTPAAEKPTGGWGNAGGSCSQPEAKNNEEVGGWNKAKVASGSQTTDWNKPKSSAGDGGSWNKQDGGSSWGKQDGGSSWGKQDGGSSWSEEDGGKSFGGGRGSGGRRGRGGRGGRDQFGRGRSFNQGSSSGWSKEGQENNCTSDGMPSGNTSGWNNDQAGGWGKSKALDGGREDGWKKPNASAGDNGSSWNKGWGADKEIGESAGQKGVANDMGGNQDSNWGKRSNWNPGSSEADKNQDSGWGNKSNWNSASSDAGGNQDSNWGKKGNWNSGSSDSNQDSGWGKKSDWNSRNAFSGNQSVGGTSEDQTQNFSDRTSGGSWGGGGGFGGRDGSDRGSFRGRGGSDRGGFGGRGRSDRGGYGGRGRSDRGGFGGRGRSDRGGFGGRGRGRRDWNNSNDSGEDKPFDWKKGANNNGEGWKSNDGAVSWNQGGGDKGQLKSWNSGSGETSSQAGGWNSKGSGWNQTAVAKDAGGSNDLAGSWNKGTGSTTETGGNQKSWNSGSGGTGNQAGGWNSKGSGWNQTAVGKDAGGSNDLAGSWNKGTGSITESGGSQKSWNPGSGGTGNQAGGWNNKGSGCNQTEVAKDAGGSNDLAGSWNKGTGSTNETGGGQGNSWKSPDVSGGGQLSSWNQLTAATKEVKGINDKGDGWNKAAGGGAQAGPWDNKGSGWNGGTGSGNGGVIEDQAETCNQSNAADIGQSSGSNQSKETKGGTNGGGEPTDSWVKAAASSWGKGSDGNDKGGW